MLGGGGDGGGDGGGGGGGGGGETRMKPPDTAAQTPLVAILAVCDQFSFPFPGDDDYRQWCDTEIEHANNGPRINIES